MPVFPSNPPHSTTRNAPREGRGVHVLTERLGAQQNLPHAKKVGAAREAERLAPTSPL
jgi:hypothetical protein